MNLTAVRSIMASVLFGMVFLWRRKPFEWKNSRFFVIFGLLLSIMNYTFYLAIARTNVAIAIMLEYTAPVFVLLFMLARRKVRHPWRSAAIAIVSVIGCFLLVGGYRTGLFDQNKIGLLVGLGCGMAFAAYNMFGEQGHRLGLDTLTMTFLSFLVSAILWCLVSPGAIYLFTDLSLLPFLLFIGLFATVLPYFLYLEGLKRVPSFPATVIGMLDPVSAWLAAALILNEALESLQVVGMLIISSLVLAVKRGGADDGAADI